MLKRTQPPIITVQMVMDLVAQAQDLNIHKNLLKAHFDLLRNFANVYAVVPGEEHKVRPDYSQYPLEIAFPEDHYQDPLEIASSKDHSTHQPGQHIAHRPSLSALENAYTQVENGCKQFIEQFNKVELLQEELQNNTQRQKIISTTIGEITKYLNTLLPPDQAIPLQAQPLFVQPPDPVNSETVYSPAQLAGQHGLHRSQSHASSPPGATPDFAAGHYYDPPSP